MNITETLIGVSKGVFLTRQSLLSVSILKRLFLTMMVSNVFCEEYACGVTPRLLSSRLHSSSILWMMQIPFAIEVSSSSCISVLVMSVSDGHSSPSSTMNSL